MEDAVLLEREGETEILTFNRPNAFNAFDRDMIGEMADRLIQLAVDPGVTGLVITGRGKAFCAGGDLRWVGRYCDRQGAVFHELAARYHQAIVEIRRMPKPVVAAINGLAAGGGFSLALACDFRIMETSAQLRLAYTSNGLSIDGAGTYSLPRLVGTAKAMEIAAFDPPIDAEKALSWGLVTEVVPDKISVTRALEMVRQIQMGSLDSFAASKKLICDSFDTPLEVQLEKERRLLAWAADQPSGKEGVSAFLEKRKPAFHLNR